MVRTLCYGRHFAMLTGLSAILLACSRCVWPGLVWSFGFYGAFHAASIVVALRRPHSQWRRLGFVIVAAGLAATSTWLGMVGRRFYGGSFGVMGASLLLALSSGIGAASYAASIRYFWINGLSFRTIVTAALGCALITLGVFRAALFMGGLGVLPIVLAWWFAFSLLLWRSAENPLRWRRGDADGARSIQ